MIALRIASVSCRSISSSIDVYCAVIELDDARDLDEVDPGAEVEGAGDLRARYDQNVEPFEPFDQRMGDRPAPAQMAETESVVAVHENAGMFQAVHNARHLLTNLPVNTLRPGEPLDLALTRPDYAMNRTTDKETIG